MNFQVLHFLSVCCWDVIFFDSYRIIRRRVVWLIGCWISVKLSPGLRPTVYECIILLLQPAEDVIVRLEAAQTLKLDILYWCDAVVEILSNWCWHFISVCCVLINLCLFLIEAPADDFEFNIQQFSPVSLIHLTLASTGWLRCHRLQHCSLLQKIHAPWFCSFRLWCFINHLLTFTYLLTYLLTYLHVYSAYPSTASRACCRMRLISWPAEFSLYDLVCRLSVMYRSFYFLSITSSVFGWQDRLWCVE